MNWTSEKPEFKDNCVLVTASKMRGIWEYSIWRIEKMYVDNQFYWGWLTADDGEEYGDIQDLKADLYAIIPKLK